MDLNVDNYSKEELLALIGILELNESEIKSAIIQQKQEHTSKKSAIFFDAIQTKLLKEIQEVPVQKNIAVEIKKGTINPDLKTTLTRLINVDSAYRNITSITNKSDSFIFELTEPLLNVVSLSFYSLELPQSWYTISTLKGTSSFILYILDTTELTGVGNVIEYKHMVSIPEGNYTTEDLCTTVISKINDTLTIINNLLPNTASYITIYPFQDSYDHKKGNLTFTFKSINPNYTIQLMWYDGSNKEPEMNMNRYNYNLGWLLGFRTSLTSCVQKLSTLNDETVNVYTKTAESLVDVSGTKYIIVSLDDYKTNRLNRSIVAINNIPNKKSTLPTYFNPSVPQVKISPTRINALPSNPRNLTSKQLYTINAITSYNVPNNLIVGYDSSNGFAKVSVKRTDWGKTVNGTTAIMDIPNKLFVENGGPLQLQSREYFGPVDILSLSVSLYDDKGNLLGLNGMDWSFSILAKCIYQY
jgi:hypothetical protein